MFRSTPTITSTDHGIILAAGRGSRLDPDEDYKLLVEIDGVPLLERHLRNFDRLGVERVTVVTGYRHAPLDAAIRGWSSETDIGLSVAVNPAFDAGNGLSVLAGVDQAERDGAVPSAVPFWLTMSDHLFEPTLFDDLAASLETGETDLAGLLVVDRDLDGIYDLDDANTLRTGGDGELEAIGKDLETFDTVDAGLFWCDTGVVDALDDERRERGDCSTSDAVSTLARRGRFGWWDLGDADWQDVDTPGARERAEELARNWSA